MKVSFILTNSKRESSPIKAVVSFNGEKYTVSTGVSVKPSSFNKKNRRVKASPEAAAINNRLEVFEAALKNAVIYFKRDFKTPTQVEFKNKVNAFLAGSNAVEIKKRDELFLPYVKNYIASCDKARETVKSYKTTCNLLEKYEKEKGITLTFGSVNMKFAEDFNKYLVDKGFSRNYIGTHFKQIKKFMKESRIVDKLHDNDDYENFKVASEVADTVYLNERELEKIFKLDINEELVRGILIDKRSQNVIAKVKSLNVVKNKFLIGAYTALRVSDFNRIQEYNIQDGCIVILPKKGSSLRKPQPVRIPMHPVVKSILESGFDPSVKISEQKINKHIKEICRMAGINDRVVTCRTEGGEVRESVHEKWEVITTHTARRSGATNMYKAGIPRKSIMMLTGHRTEVQFEKYVKLSAEENASILMNHDFFKDKKVGPGNSILALIKGNRELIKDISAVLLIDEGEVARAIDSGDLDEWRVAALRLALKITGTSV